MAFHTEAVPEHGVLLPVLPGISRIVAPNPGPMTYHGTNTFLVEDGSALAVIDPGPDNDEHIRNIAALAGGKIGRILLTHGHADHAGGARALQGLVEAPICGFAPSVFPGLQPDEVLHEGDRVSGMQVLHTPGHSSDHLCFSRPDGVLFTGDHVMAWSSTFVAAPTGDMRLFLQQLERLLQRSDEVYAPGHGPVLREPQTFVRAALAGRLRREATILEYIANRPYEAEELAVRVYPAVREPRMRRAALRMLEAHLHKLREEGRAVYECGVWQAA